MRQKIDDVVKQLLESIFTVDDYDVVYDTVKDGIKMMGSVIKFGPGPVTEFLFQKAEDKRGELFCSRMAINIIGFLCSPDRSTMERLEELGKAEEDEIRAEALNARMKLITVGIVQGMREQQGSNIVLPQPNMAAMKR